MWVATLIRPQEKKEIFEGKELVDFAIIILTHMTVGTEGPNNEEVKLVKSTKHNLLWD